MSNWLSLRRLLQALFFFATALPLCLLTAFHVQNYFFASRQNSARRLHEAAQGLAAMVDIDLTLNRKSVLATGRALEIKGSSEPRQMQAVLQDFHEEFSSFSTMLIANDQGKIVAFSAPSPSPNPNVIGSDVSDREYFRTPMTTGKPFQSSAFRGRGFGSDPIIAFASPIQLNDGKKYVVEGSLDLRSLRQMEVGYHSIPGLAVIIADQNQQVLYATPTLGIEALQVLHPSEWFRTDENGADAVGRGEFQNLGTSIVTHQDSVNGWQIYTIRPLKVIDATNQRFYAITLVLFVLALVVSSYVGTVLSQQIIHPAEQVVESLKHFAATGTATPVELGRFAPHEFRTLAGSFNSMANRLGKMLTGLLPTCAACKKVRDEQGQWSAMESFIASHTEANFTHSMCPSCIQTYYPDLDLKNPGSGKP